MSYELKQSNFSVVESELKYIEYQDRVIDWVLSEYQDESHLLEPKKLQYILPLIIEKKLNHNENLFLIKSILKILKNQVNIDFETEQNLTIITINFVEKAQQEQLHKIKNSHAIAGKILFWTQGNLNVTNTIFRTILQNATFIASNYVENLTLWLLSEQQDHNYLLTGENLELALMNSHPRLTEIENKFLVRSLVFNLRG